MAAEYQKERSCHYAHPAGCLMMNYLQSLSEWHLSLSECHWPDTGGTTAMGKVAIHVTEDI